MDDTKHLERARIRILNLEAERDELRRELDKAHQHVGALVKAIADARAAEDAFFRDSTDKHMRDEEDAQATLIITENAARAWMRGGVNA